MLFENSESQRIWRHVWNESICLLLQQNEGRRTRKGPKPSQTHLITKLDTRDNQKFRQKLQETLDTLVTPKVEDGKINKKSTKFAIFKDNKEFASIDNRNKSNLTQLKLSVINSWAWIAFSFYRHHSFELSFQNMRKSQIFELTFAGSIFRA